MLSKLVLRHWPLDRLLSTLKTVDLCVWVGHRMSNALINDRSLKIFHVAKFLHVNFTRWKIFVQMDIQYEKLPKYF